MIYTAQEHLEEAEKILLAADSTLTDAERLSGHLSIAVSMNTMAAMQAQQAAIAEMADSPYRIG